MRNYKKSINYDPFYLPKEFQVAYLPKEFQVADILAKGNVLLVRDRNSGVYFKKHPNDLKRVNKDITFNEEKNRKEEYDNELWKAAFYYISRNVEYNVEIVNSQPKHRRSQRI